ncbi:MAG TPA: chorismate mutase [Firmicutes bacterium]|nr:chorismate mutase [Bacillota bacterium]
MKVVRGAINIPANTKEEIQKGTQELFNAVLQEARIKPHQINYLIVSSTPDITAFYPCAAIRNLGYDTLPMLCVQEMDVEGSLPLTIRFLLTAHGKNRRFFCYLRDTSRLRREKSL